MLIPQNHAEAPDPGRAAAGGVRDQPRHDDRQRRPADAGASSCTPPTRSCSGWSTPTTSVFAASVLAAGSLSRPLRPQGDAAGRARACSALASLVGGLTADPGQLIAARAVMGIGAALAFPATLSLLTNVFVERGERARAIGLWGATTGIAIALGPIVGGCPAGSTSTGAASSSRWRRSPPSRRCWSRRLRARLARSAGARPIDRGGFVLSDGGDRPARSTRSSRRPNTVGAAPASLAGFALTAALIAAFVAWERRREEPMLDLALFAQPPLHGGQRLGHDRLLRPVRLHLPDHPVLPVLQGLQPALDRRAPAAGRHLRGHLLGASAPNWRCASGPSAVVGAGLLLHRRLLRSGSRPPRRRTAYGTIAAADGRRRHRHGADQRTGDGGDHGRRARRRRPGSARR